MDNKKFGNLIKELRKEKQLTQKELGEKLNITDKAISKWERGLSFPDIAILKELADFFDIDISELLNGERGKKQEIDVEKAIQEAIDNYKNIEEKRKEKIEKIKKRIGITSIIVFIILLIIQIVYLIILKRHNYEYVVDVMEYIINQIIILSATSSIVLLIKKKKVNAIIYIMAVISTIINIAFMCNNGLKNKSIVSFSKDFSNQLILKIDKNTGSIKLYKNAKLFIFAKESEQFDYELTGKIKKQWIENDICGITYKDKNNRLREYVVTYGDRGDGISYYYVINTLLGNWQVFTTNGKPTQMLVDNKGIKITKDGKSELFEYDKCKQYGTIALVLYKNEVPKYVIGLDKNCKIDSETNIIKKDGTITLAEISMDKTKLESLYCVTYKNADNLSNYSVVSVGKNDFKIQNDILYVSLDGKNVIEVPGDFSNMQDSYKTNNYQISEEKIIFYYIKDNKRYLVYSDDRGETWNTTEIENDSTIDCLQFINSKIGYMLKFEDVALGGQAFGELCKTEDGGINWTNIFYGIGDEEKNFRTSTQFKFINEKVGFLSMPSVGGEKSTIYITRDGGYNFDELVISKSDIYDYYNLPTVENGIIYIKISQGSDGDYNGGDYKVYSSNDNGENWAEQ